MSNSQKKWYESLIDGIFDFVYKLFVLVLAVFCGILAYVNCVERGLFDNCKSSSTFIRASADEATTVADVESGIDLTQYPSANLLPATPSTVSSYGLTFVIDEAGVITVNGTASSSVNYYVNHYINGWNNPLLLSGEQYYTFSCCTSKGSDSTFFCEFELYSYPNDAWSSTTLNYLAPKTFYCSAQKYGRAVIRICKGYTCNNLVFKPMLNVGDVAYPFVPNVNAIYNGGYNAGYGAGETDGYDQGKESGYNEGLTAAQRGIFDGCTVTCTTYLSGLTNFLSVTPNYINNGVDFSFIFDRWITEQGGSQSVLPNDAVEFKIKFKEGIPFSAFSVYFNQGFSYVDWTTAKVQTDFGTPNYKEYAFTTVQDDLVSKIDKKAVLVQVDVGQDTPQYISSLSFNCAWIPTFYKLQLIALNGGYTQGYNVGYYDGQNNSQLYDKGYDQGFSIGKDQGYSEGLAQGLSDDPYGFATFVYAVLDMPGRLLSNLLNFDFLGVNLAGLVTTIFSIFIVAWIVKKVV